MTEKGQGLGRVRALQLAARAKQSSRGCLHRLLCRLHCHRSIPGRDHRPGRVQDDGQPSGMNNWLDNGVIEGQGIWRRFRTSFLHSWNLPMLHLLPLILSWISFICVLVFCCPFQANPHPTVRTHEQQRGWFHLSYHPGALPRTCHEMSPCKRLGGGQLGR